MQKLVNRIFLRYGIPVQVQHDGNTMAVHGFVHYTATSARKYVLPAQTALGKVPQGHCRVLLPRNTVLEGDWLALDDRWYIVRLVERVWLENEPLYDRCLCEERGVEDQWGK